MVFSIFIYIQHSPRGVREIAIIDMMPLKCIILECESSTASPNQDVTFHRFPATTYKRRKWFAAIEKANCPVTFYAKSKAFQILCSKHFEPYDFELHHSQRILTLGAVPSIFPNTEQPAGATSGQAAANGSAASAEEGCNDESNGRRLNYAQKSLLVELAAGQFAQLTDRSHATRSQRDARWSQIAGRLNGLAGGCHKQANEWKWCFGNIRWATLGKLKKVRAREMSPSRLSRLDKLIVRFCNYNGTALGAGNEANDSSSPLPGQLADEDAVPESAEVREATAAERTGSDHLYCQPADSRRRSRWISAVDRGAGVVDRADSPEEEEEDASGGEADDEGYSVMRSAENNALLREHNELLTHQNELLESALSAELGYHIEMLALKQRQLDWLEKRAGEQRAASGC